MGNFSPRNFLLLNTVSCHPYTVRRGQLGEDMPKQTNIYDFVPKGKAGRYTKPFKFKHGKAREWIEKNKATLKEASKL